MSAPHVLEVMVMDDFRSGTSVWTTVGEGIHYLSRASGVAMYRRARCRNPIVGSGGAPGLQRLHQGRDVGGMCAGAVCCSGCRPVRRCCFAVVAMGRRRIRRGRRNGRSAAWRSRRSISRVGA